MLERLTGDKLSAKQVKSTAAVSKQQSALNRSGEEENDDENLSEESFSDDDLNSPLVAQVSVDYFLEHKMF